MSNLVIVESPTKVKTIKKFLPKNFHVAATYGHIRDLPKSSLGVDVENNFEPIYEITSGKRKVISQLKKLAAGANKILIAVDPDREGEAIGWHTAFLLGLVTPAGHPKRGKENVVDRVVFHEITKDAVLDSLNHPRSLDMHLVEAQQARRILDRLVGYKLSPLLWKKVRYGLSAGRVQSVALRLIVERETERDQFKPEEYWSLDSMCQDKKVKTVVDYMLKKDADDGEEAKKVKYDGLKMSLFSYKGEKIELKNQKEVDKVTEIVKDKGWEIVNINQKEVIKRPSPPFITSTLQQSAINKLGFSSKKTMSIAQKLYEHGHITYMRTDSLNVSNIAIDAIRKYVVKNYGQEYLAPQIKLYKTKSKNAQEAHEAIRPTDVSKTSEKLDLIGEQKALYDLIWRRTIATQMADARLRASQIDALIENYIFRTNTQKVIFKGFLQVYKVNIVEQEEPKIAKGEFVYPSNLIGYQHFTQPPARYSEASIIKELEKYGIGRPSTYASIISTIIDRGYVEKIQKYLAPTDTGKVVNRFLVDNFEKIVDVDFTASMENDLDEIALGHRNMRDILSQFYNPFEKEIEEKNESIKRKDYTVLGESDEKCPECGSPMVIKLGKYGKFFSCSRFPDCKGMKSFEDEQNPAMDIESNEFKEKYADSPKTDDGRDFMLKIGKFGKFWAHPDYPKVKEAKPLLLKEICPECGHNLTERISKWKRVFIGCSNYPNCKFIKKEKLKKNME